MSLQDYLDRSDLPSDVRQKLLEIENETMGALVMHIAQLSLEIQAHRQTNARLNRRAQKYESGYLHWQKHKDNIVSFPELIGSMKHKADEYVRSALGRSCHNASDSWRAERARDEIRDIMARDDKREAASLERYWTLVKTLLQGCAIAEITDGNISSKLIRERIADYLTEEDLQRIIKD